MTGEQTGKEKPEYSFYVTGSEYIKYYPSRKWAENIRDKTLLVEGKYYEQAQKLLDIYVDLRVSITGNSALVRNTYRNYFDGKEKKALASIEFNDLCQQIDKIKLADRKVLKELRLNPRQDNLYLYTDVHGMNGTFKAYQAGPLEAIGPHAVLEGFGARAESTYTNYGEHNKGLMPRRAYEFEQLLVNEIAEKLNDIYKSEKPDLKLYKRLGIIANGLSKAGAPLPSKHVGLYLRAVIDGGKINKLYNENSTWHKANKDKANIEDLKKKLDASIGPKGSFWKSMTGLAKVGYRNIKHILNTRRNRKLGQNESGKANIIS